MMFIFSIVSQGGDWSVNRFAAVVAEGVEELNISGCTFTRLDNGGIFIVSHFVVYGITVLYYGL